MKVISARNVQAALPLGLDYLERNGVRRESRNGPVIVSPCPVTTHYQKPRERVIFWAERDANPFFHFFEALWMLAGKNDVAYLSQFVPAMANYSDDGETFHGAYGHRWLHHFYGSDPGNHDLDQLTIIMDMLKANPDERRCVLQMWDAEHDLGGTGKDLPCNTQAYFLVNEGRLDMTVCNRSNDMILGCYGANAVHFSMLQEFMAAGIGVEVGGYWQISNNFHAYVNKDLEKVKCLTDMAPDPFRTQVCDPYREHAYEPFPMVSTPIAEWWQDLFMFLDEGVVIGLRDKFFRKVATPLYMAHRHYKQTQGRDKYIGALEILERCEAADWQAAAQQWILRRLHKFEEKS